MAEMTAPPASGIGHNIHRSMITVEVRLFNSLTRFTSAGRLGQRISLPAGSNVGDVTTLLSVPKDEVYLVLRNGRDVTRSLYAGINFEAEIDDGDVIALSGPVPYSWGYGAPVV